MFYIRSIFDVLERYIFDLFERSIFDLFECNIFDLFERFIFDVSALRPRYDVRGEKKVDCVIRISACPLYISSTLVKKIASN
jgi:hypothetical protein